MSDDDKVTKYQAPYTAVAEEYEDSKKSWMVNGSLTSQGNAQMTRETIIVVWLSNHIIKQKYKKAYKAS